MKKLFVLISFFFLLTLSVNAQNTTATDQKTEKQATTEVKTAEEPKLVTVIDKAGFLKYVYNYEKSPSKWIYEGKLPCIVDFYADWCGPCRMIAPIIEELAKEYKGKIVVYKVNTQYTPELSQVFQIRSIPTLFFCPLDGQAQAISGAYPKEQLKLMIETILLKNTNYMIPAQVQPQQQQQQTQPQNQQQQTQTQQ